MREIQDNKKQIKNVIPPIAGFREEAHLTSPFEFDLPIFLRYFNKKSYTSIENTKMIIPKISTPTKYILPIKRVK